MSNDPISTDETQITLTLPERVGMEQIVGPSDCVLREVKRAFSARITVRGDTIALSGDAAEVQSLTALFSDFIKMAAAGSDPTIDDARRAVELCGRANSRRAFCAKIFCSRIAAARFVRKLRARSAMSTRFAKTR